MRSAGFIINERNATPIEEIVHYIGLEVHKETVAGVAALGGVIANEPIYSLRFRRRSEAMVDRLPGFAGK